MIVESYEDVIGLSGPLRANFWEAVQTAIGLTLRRHPTGVILDCHGITDINEDGARTFAQAMDYVFEHDGARIIFARVPEHVMETLRVVPEVRSQMAVSASVEEARRSLDLLAAAEEAGRRKREKRSHQRRVLAVMCPRTYDPHLIQVTRDLVSDDPADVVLLLPIVIPRELPLQAAMPESEERAQAFAAQASAAFVKEDASLEVRLERTRDLAGLVAGVAEEVDACQIVVSVAAARGDESVGRTMGAVMDKTERPIIFVRAQVGG